MPGIRKKKSPTTGGASPSTDDQKSRSEGALDANQGEPASSGASQSKRQARFRNDVEKITSSINSVGTVDEGVPSDQFEYKPMFLAEIEPERNNSRTRHIDMVDPLNNRLPKDHPDYEENEAVIADIRTMSEHLKTNVLQSPISVYRRGTRHFVNEGHVRYFAMVIAHGKKARVDCKVFSVPPADAAARRFRENHARNDLALKPKIMDFRLAEDAVEGGRSMSERALGHSLGIAKTSVRFCRLAGRNEVIWPLVEEGIIRRLASIKLLDDKSILDNEARLKAIEMFLRSPEGSEEELAKFISGQKIQAKKVPPKRTGRPRQNARIVSGNPTVLKKLVKGDLYEEFGWSDSDFESIEAFQKKMDQCLKHLEKKANG